MVLYTGAMTVAGETLCGRRNMPQNLYNFLQLVGFRSTYLWLKFYLLHFQMKGHTTDINKCKNKNWKERSKNRVDWEKSIN
jgi:hypothetical protein